MVRADDRGEPELAAHDRGVAGPAAAVGHDRRRALHDRLPVRIGLVGDEDLAGLEVGELLDRLDHADPVPDAATADEHAPWRVEAIGLEHRVGLARLHGLGPRLDHEQLAGDPVLGPLDVHRALAALAGGVVRLDQAAPAGEGEDVVIAEREPRPIAGGHGHVLRHLAAAGGVDELELLRAQVLGEDWPRALRERRLEHVVLVGVHRPLHDVLAEPVGRVDEHDVPEPRLGVEREHDAGDREVRAHHALDADRERDLHRIEAAIGAIRDGAVGEQRREAALAAVDQRGVALHVQVGLLLPGEARVGQVLRRRAAADRDVDALPAPLAQPIVGVRDRALERGRELRGHDRLAELEAALAQLREIAEPRLGFSAGREAPVRVRGRREAVRDLDPLWGQRSVHLAERGVLPSNLRDVIDADLLEPSDERGPLHGCRHGDSLLEVASVSGG